MKSSMLREGIGVVNGLKDSFYVILKGLEE